VNLTSSAQHGFNKIRSTIAAGLTIPSISARALDNNKNAMMSSLDLSAAFNMVNVKLLVKRLKIVGLPIDVTDLIEIWLSNCKYCVNIDGNCSMYYTLESGILHSSILGPFLYVIYVSALFDLTDMSSFADKM
jgi:hypothetical protein